MSLPFKRAKDPHAQIVLGFDMARDLASGETLSTPDAATITVASGTDASPSSMANGSPTVSGTKVLVPVKGGVDGCVYSIEVGCTTSNASKKLYMTGLLTVREGG